MFDKKNLDEIFKLGYNATKAALTNTELHKIQLPLKNKINKDVSIN